MKYSALLSFLILLACGGNRNDAMTQLLSEQKFLKDSANNLNESIGAYMQKSLYDSAAAQQKRLKAVHARLIAIQTSIDNLEK